jgi:type IV pilus assembly protein PilQ
VPKDVPWIRPSIFSFLQARNLGVRKTGNVLLIAPKDELAAKENSSWSPQLWQTEPLRTQDV